MILSSLGNLSSRPSRTSISGMTRGVASTSIHSIGKKSALTSITNAAGNARTSTSIHQALKERNAAATTSAIHTERHEAVSGPLSQHAENEAAADKRFNENRDKRVAAYRLRLRQQRDKKS